MFIKCEMASQEHALICTVEGVSNRKHAVAKQLDEKQQQPSDMIGKCEVFLQVQVHACIGTGAYNDLSNGTLRMGVSSRKRAACCGGTTVMPEGLCRGPARRAANLPSAMPNDMLKPSSFFTAALMLPTT